jgi:membrane protease YdiL (CAAX protease family)
MTDQDYQPISSRRQLFYLFLFFVGGIFVGLAISLAIIALIYGKAMAWNVALITHTDAPCFVGAFRIFIGLGNTLAQFLAPALVFTYLVMRDPVEYIGARNYYKPALLLLVVAFMLFFLPVIEITSFFNQKMTLPASWSGLEKWIRKSEADNEAIFKIIMDMKTAGDYLLSILVVAIFPAVAEEFFFRGCMQRIFEHMTKNVHAAVWITAFIFSFMHFEFLGFVPRFLLGAGLGYLYAWSGSIWPSVLTHFINNGFAVTGLYLYQHKYINSNPNDSQLSTPHLWVYFLSFAVSIGILLAYRKITLTSQEVYRIENEV